MRLIASEETFQKRALDFPSPAWELTFPFKQRQLRVRPVFPDECLQPVFRLVFDVYIREQGLLALDKLPQACREACAKWDEWDLLPTTRHFVAFDGEELIGHSRIIDEPTIGLPIERTGFDLRAERADGHPLSEVSKTVIRRPYRASPVLSALLWQVFHQVRLVERRQRILLTCDPSFTKVYRRLGAREIGTFMSREFGVMYAAMRLEFRDTFNEHADSEVASADPPRLMPSAVSEEELTSLANASIPHLTVKSFKYEALAFGSDAVSGVWRVTTDAPAEASAPMSWRCIIKVFPSEPTESSLASSDALSNELASYQSCGFLREPSRLRMPRLLRKTSSPGQCTLFLEDVSDPHSRALEVQDLCDFGFQLGAWHAENQDAGQAKTPNRWLASYVTDAEPLVASIPGYAQEIPLLDPLAVEPWASQAGAVWANRQMLLQALGEAPHSMCHQDLVAGNVVVTPEPAGVIYSLIDWSTFGSAPLGAELAPLLIGNPLLMRWKLESSMAVASEVIRSYQMGLCSRGLSISERELRFSLMASAALRYIAWGGHRIEAVINPSRRHLARAITGHSIADMVKSYSQIRQQVTAWGLTALKEIHVSPILSKDNPG